MTNQPKRNLLDVIKEMAPDKELADSIEKGMKETRRKTIMSKLQVNQKVKNSVEIMKLLNKAQLISKKLHELKADAPLLEVFDKNILELSLIPVDIIGENVYLDFFKNNKIKTIAQPMSHGWYQVKERNET